MYYGVCWTSSKAILKPITLITIGLPPSPDSLVPLPRMDPAQMSGQSTIQLLQGYDTATVATMYLCR